MKQLPLIISFLTLLIGISSCSSELQEGKIDYKGETFSYQGKFPWKFKIIRFPFSEESEVIYYFHGSGGSIDSLVASPLFSQMSSYWIEKETAPIIVSISLGPQWVLVPENDLPLSGQLDFFWNDIEPEIKKHLTGELQKRYLIGYSMGGFNALSLLLSNPMHFDKVILQSPALYSISPFSSSNEKIEYMYSNNTIIPNIKEKMKSILGHGSYLNSINLIQNARLEYISSDTVWQEASPFVKATRDFHSNFPPLYISCGRRDPFGFYGSSERLVAIAEEKGIEVTWKPLAGGHTSQDGASVAQFLISEVGE